MVFAAKAKKAEKEQLLQRSCTARAQRKKAARAKAKAKAAKAKAD